VEIGPVSTCNHACEFCYYHETHTLRDFIDADRLCRTFAELKSLGTKAIFYSGEGEPLLHKRIPDIIEAAALHGFDQAVNTNATPLRGATMERILPHLSWIRVSLNGVDEADYARAHRTDPRDFQRVLDNLAQAVAFKRANDLEVVIGTQFIFTGQTIDAIGALCRRVRDIGVDYFTVKQFNPHSKSPLSARKLIIPPPEAFDSLKAYSTADFQVTVRFGIVEQDWQRPYKRCLALPFFAEIVADGKVYACGPHVGEKEFCYGSIYEMDFKTLWGPANRETVERHVRGIADLDHVCMPNCRPDHMNRLLWELENPPMHVNFI